MADKSVETPREDSFANQVQEIAQWMMGQLNEGGYLHQHFAVGHIRDNYDPATFLYRNKNGNPAIHKEILAAFKRLHGGTAKWNRRSFSWKLEKDAADDGA